MPITIRSALAAAAAAIVFCAVPFESAYARPGVDFVKCETGSLGVGDGTKDLVIDRPCKVPAGTFRYRDVNVVQGGDLLFEDVVTDFWATSILVENEGSLIAGSGVPVGTKGGKLTIHLYGRDQGAGGGKGIICVTPGGTCGVPDGPWNHGLEATYQMPGTFKVPDSGKDNFEKYSTLPLDDGEAEGYFGYKVLAVSYGGTLQLFGAKGATYGDVADSNSGTSWVRLSKSVKPTDCAAGTCKLELDRKVDWAMGDEIVLTTTDYLPGHSERLTITAVENVDDASGPAGSKKTIVTVAEKFKWPHNGAKFSMSIVPDRLGLGKDSAETRAAVALLTRSIRIVSAGETLDAEFPPAPTWSANSEPGYFFGGHTLIRQGAKQVQLQGVQFKQLGQGGRIGHYPVHFHAARLTPDDTFIKDSTVDESMTRWFVIHATQNVTLARNVGYASIGHGYYLEEGTEINNRLVSNIGILARAAVNDEQNPRKVPGILAAKTANNLSSDNPAAYRTELVPFYSDYDHPAVFWIMNGWNDFEYNMAVGAGACGVCYWLLPGANSGHSRHLPWKGYASMQADPTGINPTERAGLTPLKNFIGNYCSTASMSFNTVANTTACIGIGASDVPNPDNPLIKSIPNPLAPDACDQSNPHQKKPNEDKLEPYACGFPSDAHTAANNYYPQIGGGGRFPTKCADEKGDCSNVPQCSAGRLDNCMVTVIDNYTSSFHWAEQNFAAIWLRPQWYLMQNSVLTDVINGGLTFVTGGGYTASDAIPGHWALAFRNAFIGETQPGNAYASIGSPFNPAGLACDAPGSANHCLSAKEGVSFPKGNFGVNARLFNIYDGPAYQDSNAYLNIKSLPLDCTPGSAEYSLSNCGSSKFLQGPSTGVPRDGNTCYLPNAAIGWKQPNGFYYPPAFHSDNLFFSDVDIRHYVTQPLFKPGTYQTDAKAAWGQYCNWQTDMFNNWTDIDRQTELNDDDGSLTGYVHTISVNEDPFFKAPRDAIECASDETVGTSPYDYVTSVVYPACVIDNSCPQIHPAYISDPNARASSWNKDCGGPFCYGVPLYRQLVTASEFKTPPANAPHTFMAGQGTGQRSTLAVNNGVFYMDTTVGGDRQSAAAQAVTPANPPVPQIPSPVQKTSYNVFQPGGIYYTFLVFAKPTTTQTYQLYVGTKDFNELTDVWPVQVDIKPDPPVYTPNTQPASPTFPAGWDVKYDKTTGILKVTMAMKFDAFKTNWDKAQLNACAPKNFCALTTDAAPVCACARDANGKLDPLCQDSVCAWAGNDPDCPEGGCWGFGFKLPNTFATDVVPNPRPATACFSRKDPVWNANATWKEAPEPVAGTKPVCYQAPVNPDDFCD